jgi:serine/threonine-protein kinase
MNNGTLFAVPFNLDQLEAHGTPTPVLENVAYTAAYGSAQIDFSRTGTLVYQSSKAGSGLVTIQWLDESGNTRPLFPVPGNYLSPTLSPDGSPLALTSAGDIRVYPLGRGSMVRLTFGGGYTNPVWSADASYIVFRSARGMLSVRADGTAQPELLIQGLPWSFTPDGKRLAFNNLSPANIDDILDSAGGDRERRASSRKAAVVPPSPLSKREARCSHPTGSGSPTSPTRPVGTECTCKRFQTGMANGKFPVTAVLSRRGRTTGATCSFGRMA